MESPVRRGVPAWRPAPLTGGRSGAFRPWPAASLPVHTRGWPLSCRPGGTERAGLASGSALLSSPMNSLHAEVCLESRTVSPLLQHFTRPHYHIKGRKGRRGCPSLAAASWGAPVVWKPVLDAEEAQQGRSASCYQAGPRLP